MTAEVPTYVRLPGVGADATATGTAVERVGGLSPPNFRFAPCVAGGG